MGTGGLIPRYHPGIAEQWKTFLVRITPEQHAKLERIARDRDRSIAWVIRNLIDRVQEPKT
jgi:predicted HicB family RNase H-like nuclease